MRLPQWIVRGLFDRAQAVVHGRRHDFLIGEPDRPYLMRWWILPRNPVFNIYLHVVLRSDDDRAHHDHPWVNCSIMLGGSYIEHEILAGGIDRRSVATPGNVRFRRGRTAHRLEIAPGTFAMTLFITGPRLRDWGFHCPRAGWVQWEKFTAPGAKGQIGKGCGE